jgi:hypothetical protein
MTGTTWASSAVAAVCVFAAACDSSKVESGPATSSTLASESAIRDTTTASTADELPLYGIYLRNVPALSDASFRDWGINFGDGQKTSGVLEVFRMRARGPRGHAYKYASDGASLRIERPARPRTGLPPGAFDCGSEQPATYAWSRTDRNYTLNLRAIDEPCAVRRTILEGEWHFFD